MQDCIIVLVVCVPCLVLACASRGHFQENGAKEMDLSTRRQPPTVRLRRLAAELRTLRTTAGLTRDEISEQTNINPATLYRIETAKVRPQRRTLLALLDRYGVTDEARRAELVGLSRDSTQLGWF